ncbi:MAG: TM2 domain-containing protein [Planctomycetes bacterium]|jgi:TM2 domain-containing membrane protein YozV|nr:TM2 domain-containing protein [Planctomycetota bacterium]MCL4728834.1 TM2 domain-containing protein [Planctomycetota bacterium]
MAGSPPPGQNPYQGYPQQQPPQGYPPQGAYPQQPVNPQAPYGVHPRLGLPYSDKQKLVAGLLQLFLGGFGVGRFYTGHTGIAIAQIAVTWLTCGVGALWPLIDGIIMLTNDEFLDANGLPLRPN